MKNAKIITDLLDEMAVLSVISKELPAPYNVMVQHQIVIIDNYLVELNSTELEKNNDELENNSSDLIKVFEPNQGEPENKTNAVREIFCGQIIENKTFNS